MTAPDARWRRAAAAAHRAALVAYPAAFRRSFAADLEHVFAARVDRARARGLLPALAAAAWGITDALGSGLAERAGRRPDVHGRRRRMALDGLASDVRASLRALGAGRVTTATVVGILALGIGAAAAVFAVVDSVLLEPLPYGQARRLVMVWSDNTHEARTRNPVAPADFLDFARSSRSFQALGAMTSFLSANGLTDGGRTDVVQTSVVTATMFDVLGRQPLIGRTFTDDAASELVLSYGFWMRRYGGDASILGRTVGFDAASGTIVGVMPPDFTFPYRTMLGPSGFSTASTAEVWASAPFMAGFFYDQPNNQPARQARFLGLIGRLAPGASAASAQAELETVAADLARAHPRTNAGWSATVVPLQDQVTGGTRNALLLLFGGVGAVLLMACANIAHVLLSRSLARQRELAVRTALGASRARLVRQTLIESLLQAAAGGLLALPILRIGLQLLDAFAPADLPRLGDVRVTGTATLFVPIASLVVGLLTGAAPALSVAALRLGGLLREAGRGATAGPAARRTRAGLVVAEMAMAMTLTTMAALLFRSFVAVLAVNPGFDSDGLLTAHVNVPAKYATSASRVAYYDDLLGRLSAIPGVTRVGGTTRLPLGSTRVSTQLQVEGRSVPTASLPEVEYRRALYDYFEAMDVPIVRGRSFTAADGPSVPLVAIVNVAASARIFPSEDPIGRRVRIGTAASSPWATIVGVVGDVRHGSLEELPRPELYTPARQGPPVSPYLVLRTTRDPSSVAAELRAAVAAVDATTPVYDVRPMTALRHDAVAQRRFALGLTAMYTLLALVLAASGIYGVLSVTVSERASEVGLRMALGASRRQIVGLVLGGALRLGGAGVAIGLALAALAAPLLASQLFGVTATDLPSYAAVAAVLMAVCGAGALAPARRAMRVDPIVAMKE